MRQTWWRSVGDGGSSHRLAVVGLRAAKRVAELVADAPHVDHESLRLGGEPLPQSAGVGHLQLAESWAGESWPLAKTTRWLCGEGTALERVSHGSPFCRRREADGDVWSVEVVRQRLALTIETAPGRAVSARDAGSVIESARHAAS